MSKAKRLSLDSPLWKRLGTFEIPSARLPVVLRVLIDEPVDPANPALNEMMAAIFHQHSVGDATYAAMPYLVDICVRYAHTNPRLFYLAANIAASANLNNVELPAEIRLAFLEALIAFENIAVARIMKQGRSAMDVYNDTLAGIAFSGHCCGKLMMDTLEVESTRRTFLVCPNCQQRMGLMLFDDGAVVTEAGRKLETPDARKSLARPGVHSYPERQPNPWLALKAFLVQQLKIVTVLETEQLHVELAIRMCATGLNPKMPPEDLFSFIAANLITLGFAGEARRFLRLWDTIVCPHCKCSFMAAKGWWGCSM